MKYIWVGSAVVGIAAGVALGFAISARLHHLPQPTGSALLREFSLPAISAKTTCTNWHILEDRIYEQFPPLARSRRIARRIVARTEMPVNDVDGFSTSLQQAIRRIFDAQGAMNKGFYDLTQSGSKYVEGVHLHSRVHLPRWFYAIGETHGVADFWYVAESGRVTLMVSFIEGP
jgi:hypothetical protein